MKDYPQIIDNMVPCYILDLSYNIMAWNIACHEALALPMGWSLGMSATKIIETLVNADECRARSFKVFGLDSLPLVDWEPLIFDHPKYGRTTFQKYAAQIINKAGHHEAWTVQYNIIESEKLEQYSRDIMTRIQSELQKRLSPT
ncbi:MAG: hypothetical protein C5B49_14890 [Bdellovibrio sp.]|nr:MAG: hypothetical protein C5B49_14890 [Bdellovibrio sp.]